MCGAPSLQRCSRERIIHFEMKPRTGLIAAGLTLAAALLSACALGVVTQTSYDVVFRSGVPSSFAYGGQKGDMLVRIVNNPFAAPAQEVNAAVVAQMQGQTVGPPTRLSSEPNERMIPGYAIVLGFDLPVWYDPGALCRAGAAAPPADTAAARLTLLMVFCEGDDWLTWVKGSAPRPATPQDTQFQRLIAQSTFQLIPMRNDGGGRGFDLTTRRGDVTVVAR
jgi:hypothetical protein